MIHHTHNHSISVSGPGYTCSHFNEEFKYILLPVSYGLVFVLGLVLNAMALWLFIAKMRPWKTFTVFMVHLAVSDILYVLALPPLIYYYANHGHWPFGVALCKVARFLFYKNLYCSILFLTCMSVYRYIGICHPMTLTLTRVRPRHAHLVCGLVWAVVTVGLVPNLIFVTTSQRGNDTLCHDTTVPDTFKEYVDYSTVVMVLLFGVPCLIIMLCYCQMAQALCRPRQGLRSGQHQKSIRLLVVVLVVFTLCFVPFHITRTLYYIARVLPLDCTTLNIVNFAYKICRPLACANCCLDPLLYLFSDHFRGTLIKALRPERQTNRPSTVIEENTEKKETFRYLPNVY